MQKILTLGPENWLAGLCIADDYGGGGGTFVSADGFDVFKEPGFLQQGYIVAEIGAGKILQTPQWFVPTIESSVGYVYALGSVGALYKIAISNDGVTDVSTAIDATSSLGQGIAIGKAFNGSVRNMVYAETTDVRKNTVPPASGTDASIGTVTSSSYHPVYFAGVDQEFYIGDVNEVDAWDGATYNSRVLDLDDDLTITSFSDDGRYLIVGATSNPADLALAGRSKIFFWNTWGPTWQKSWEIPERTLGAILKDGQKFYAFGRRGIYEFDFYTPPRMMFRTQTSATAINFNPKAGGVDIWKGMLLWADTGEIRCYGSTDRRISKALFSPFDGFTAIQGIKAIDSAKIYVGDNSNGYVLKSSNQTGKVATTPYINLGRPWHIRAVKLVTSKLADGQKIAVTIKNDTGLNNIISGDYDYDVEGAVTQGKVFGKGTATTAKAEQIQIGLTFTGGVKLKRLEVWGDPQPREEL